MCNHHRIYIFFFFFNDTATTEIYTLSLHDALPIYRRSREPSRTSPLVPMSTATRSAGESASRVASATATASRSEEHTSELQSRLHLVCRLLLEKKKIKRSHWQRQSALRCPKHNPPD